MTDTLLNAFIYLAAAVIAVPIAKRLGYPEDWRTPAPPADDLGERPDLDQLGPFRWSPASAGSAFCVPRLQTTRHRLC